jgi:hypothetical protein
MAFTEFYVQTSGSNLNAGSTADDAAPYSYAGGTFVRATGVFTPASGNPQTDGVAVGMFASIFTTAGATVAKFVARVTARDATTITVSTTAKSGAATDVSEGAGEATCKVGGAWAGPSGAVLFPLTFATSTLMEATGNPPRVNIKSGTTYSVTATVAFASPNVMTWQGYTTTVGDGGRATLSSGVTTATNFTSANSNAGIVFADLIFASTQATDNRSLLSVSGGLVYRCVATGARLHGFVSADPAAPTIFVECESYGNGTSVNCHGFLLGTVGTCVRCIAHDNAGMGYSITYQGVTLVDCIADSNGSDGINSGASVAICGCDLYNNTGDGIHLSPGVSAAVYVSNCNFIKNGGYGINATYDYIISGCFVNCGFGAGTQANTSGATSGIHALAEIGTITYAANVTPWTDPANGDFTLALAAAKGTGRGAFTQTAASYAGTTSKPDIGAAARGGVLPAVADVEDGVFYGAAGTEFEGTFVGGGAAATTRAWASMG